MLLVLLISQDYQEPQSTQSSCFKGDTMSEVITNDFVCVCVCVCLVPSESVIMPQLVGFLASSSTFLSHSSGSTPLSQLQILSEWNKMVVIALFNNAVHFSAYEEQSQPEFCNILQQAPKGWIITITLKSKVKHNFCLRGVLILFEWHWIYDIEWVYCAVAYLGRGSVTCQLSPSSLVLAAVVLSGFRLSSLGLSLKFPDRQKHWDAPQSDHLCKLCVLLYNYFAWA